MTRENSLGADYFEALYRSNPDPWNFTTSEYEDRKYQATLGALTCRSYARAIEVGCSVGVLTARLAQRCKWLDAVDLSPTAIKKAKAACAAHDNVGFHVAAAPHDLPQRPFDLIVLSEVLYYLAKADLQLLATWCQRAADGRAEIVLCHWLGPTNYPLSGALASDLFVQAVQPSLERHTILHEDVYRLERIQLHAKEA